MRHLPPLPIRGGGWLHGRYALTPWDTASELLKVEGEPLAGWTWLLIQGPSWHYYLPITLAGCACEALVSSRI